MPTDPTGQPFIQSNPSIPLGFGDLAFIDFSCHKFPHIAQVKIQGALYVKEFNYFNYLPKRWQEENFVCLIYLGLVWDQLATLCQQVPQICLWRLQQSLSSSAISGSSQILTQK